MIEKTKIEDIDKIMEIYRIGKDIQVKSGNPDQWEGGRDFGKHVPPSPSRSQTAPPLRSQPS